jgi:hypothetical protein
MRTVSDSPPARKSGPQVRNIPSVSIRAFKTTSESFLGERPTLWNRGTTTPAAADKRQMPKLFPYGRRYGRDLR